MIRVVLADDQALLRAGIRSLLDSEDDIEVVGEASSGQEAVRVVRDTVPDVVLMDIRMPGGDGLDATREIVDDGALTTALNWYRALPLSDPRDAQVKITVPTTFVWSSDDVALGRWGAEHTEEYVDADYHFVALDGLSHWLPTEAPDLLADAILSRVRG